jgi:hypothetical protein
MKNVLIYFSIAVNIILRPVHFRWSEFLFFAETLRPEMILFPSIYEHKHLHEDVVTF